MRAGRFGEDLPASGADRHFWGSLAAVDFPRIQFGTAALVLAPMEGVTDGPMRAILSETGAFSFCVSEFLRVSAMVPPPKVFFRHVPELYTGACTASGTPVAVQLLGGDPGRMAQAAAIAVEVGSPAIDLNFGCPAKTVNRHDGGAALLKCPARIESIVGAVRAAVPKHVPVSAKLRLGWEDRNDIHATAEAAVKGGADWLTIHARTKEQGYQPPVYWGLAGDVRRNLGVPVVVNGDIWSIDDFKRCRDETQSEHYMLGRGAVASPDFAAAVARELGLKPGSDPIVAGKSPSDWLPLIRRFADLALVASPTEHYATRRIKQWLGQAERRGSFQGFETIKRIESLSELLRTLGTVSPSSYSPSPPPR